MAAFWIPGITPIQFLLLFACLFAGGIALQHALSKQGLRITGLWQVVFFWIASYACLAYVVAPPLPSHLFLTYVGAITIALFFFVSASEPAWTECKQSIGALFTGATPAYRLLRAGLFVATPVFVFVTLHNHLRPFFEEPIELRAYHSAPPASIMVHGERFELQTAKNPFRVGEGLKPPSGR